MENYIEIDGIWFTSDTNIDFARWCIKAMKEHRRVRITYKTGWEDFSGYHGGDGRHHTMYIGKSTGTKPVLLCIHSKRSIGGCQLITSSNAIQWFDNL